MGEWKKIWDMICFITFINRLMREEKNKDSQKRQKSDKNKEIKKDEN